MRNGVEDGSSPGPPSGVHRGINLSTKACAIESVAMIDFNHIKFVLDDSLHPGTAPVWVAIIMAVLLVLLTIAYFKPLLRLVRRRKRHGYDASLAYHQKIHEGERW
jgi:hypothetical protein